MSFDLKIIIVCEQTQRSLTFSGKTLLIAIALKNKYFASAQTATDMGRIVCWKWIRRARLYQDKILCCVPKIHNKLHEHIEYCLHHN